MGIKTTRKFDGKVFELRVQPSDKMHRGFIDPYTVGNKYEAENIVKHRRARGEEVRLVRVKSGEHTVGWRIYWRKA